MRYVQLAHNERREHGASVARVIHSFGREDQVDRAALARLVASISRFLALDLEQQAHPPCEVEWTAATEPDPAPAQSSRRQGRGDKRTLVWTAPSHRQQHDGYVLTVVSGRAIALVSSLESSRSAPAGAGPPHAIESVTPDRLGWKLEPCIWCRRLTPCGSESASAGGSPTG